MRRSPGACFLVLALALSIGACGEDEPPTPPPPDPSETPRQQVAGTVNDYFAAVADGDAELAYLAHEVSFSAGRSEAQVQCEFRGRSSCVDPETPG